MKKVLIVVATIILILILGIGGKFYMDKQAENEEILKAIAKDKEQIEEIVRWNFKDVKKVTFDWVKSEGDGSISAGIDKSLTTTPVGGELSIHWYLNDDRDIDYSLQILYWKNYELSGYGRALSAYRVKKEYGENVDPTDYSSAKIYPIFQDKFQANEKFKRPLYKDYAGQIEYGIGGFILGIKDINKLKTQGYTDSISDRDILKYWEDYDYDIKDN